MIRLSVWGCGRGRNRSVELHRPDCSCDRSDSWKLLGAVEGENVVACVKAMFHRTDAPNVRAVLCADQAGEAKPIVSMTREEAQQLLTDRWSITREAIRSLPLAEKYRLLADAIETPQLDKTDFARNLADLANKELATRLSNPPLTT